MADGISTVALALSLRGSEAALLAMALEKTLLMRLGRKGCTMPSGWDLQLLPAKVTRAQMELRMAR